MNITLGLLVIVGVVCLVSALSRRFNLSAPLVLVLLGLISSFLPFTPDVVLEPDLVLIGLLPPLLYAAAIRTSLIDFSANRRSIGMLSIGYVIFAAVGIGFLTHALLGIPLAASFALGAVVAPPDAVAATAIARRVGMPRRVVTILEGESLVNDATALVLFRTAIAAAAGGSASFVGVAGNFVLAAGGGVVIGVAVAFALVQIRKRVKDVMVNTTMSLAAPFIAYIPAEEIHASGVLAVVVAGLLIGHKSPAMPSGASRVSERTNWATVQFLLENSVFLLIGLQVKAIVADVQKDSLPQPTIWLSCAAILVAVLVLRPIWVFPATYLPFVLSRKIRERQTRPPWQVPAVVSWAGMRGVVTLAAVFALPDGLEHKSVLFLAALVVVFGTLIIQGSTLPLLVRRLGLRGPDPREDLLQHAATMQAATEAGLAALDSLITPDDPPEVLAMIRRRTQERGLSAWERLGRPESEKLTPSQRYAVLRLKMLEAERAKVLELRNSGAVAHEVLSEVLGRLDVEESMLDSRLEQEAPRRDEDLVTPKSLENKAGCEHLGKASSDTPPLSTECLDCAREDTRPVHLRICLSCGNVGCCDSSVGRHADRHFKESGHPVMRSFEPGEAWRWCYLDELLG
ncbi:Na+/H+ antiporter [Nakamurella antarctica]|uniref:Na+/H+ antiporter n=1 Tax=Nakamurella antarctica TaxID=1902245 RepID=A0A3G8ZPP6_9ACTN|nr:Na+/H+ antiporter [Nakamurella antarctica]AZI59118.1 Na+/H+ antiporter [Nakamurella antarctica]